MKHPIEFPKRPRTAADESWWIDAPPIGFTARAWVEEPRMRYGRCASFVTGFGTGRDFHQQFASIFEGMGLTQ